MRVLVALTAALALTSCRHVQLPERVVMAPARYPVRDLRFPSGLRVVLEQDHRSPTIAVAVVVGVGGVDDPKGKEGLAHLVEHLTFRARAADARSLRHRLERAGASNVNAETEFEITTYLETAPREALAEVLSIEGQRLLAPLERLRSDDLSRERDIIKNELLEHDEHGRVAQIAGWLQAETFPPNHPYVRPIGGTLETIAGCTLDDARAFARAYYHPDRVTLVVVGDFDLGEAAQVVRQTLPLELQQGDAPDSNPRLPPSQETPLSSPRPITRRQAPVRTPELWVAWTLPRGFDDLSTMLEFVSAAADGAAAGAATPDSDIRDTTSQLLSGAQASVFLVRARLREGKSPEDSVRRIALHLGYLGYIGQGGMLRDYAMSRLKWGSVVGTVLASEHPLVRARQRAVYTHFTRDARAMGKAHQQIVNLRPDKMADFAHTFFALDRARAVLVTPEPPAGPLALPPKTPGSPVAMASLLEPAADTPGLGRPPGAARAVTFTLPTGLEVIVLERHGLPVATVALSLHGGSGLEGPDGVTALAERVAHSYDTQDGHPFEVGVSAMRPITSDDAQYIMQGASGNVSNMLAMIAERVRSVRATDIALEEFRRYELPLMRLDEEWPGVKLHGGVMAELYGRHPYGRVMTTAVLEKLGRDDVMAWIRRTHHPRNAVLAIVGDVDPVQVEPWVRELFGGWSDEGSPQSPPPPPQPQGAQPPRFVVVPNPGASQIAIEFACLIPSGTVSAQASAAIAAEIMQMRLSRVLREQLGITYDASARVHLRRGGSAHLLVETSVERAGLGAALPVIHEALRAFAAGQFEPNELEQARAAVERDEVTQLQTNLAWAERLLDVRNRDLPLSVLDEYPGGVMATSPEAVQSVFHACEATPPVLGLSGDPSTLQQVHPLVAR